MTYENEMKFKNLCLSMQFYSITVTLNCLPIYYPKAGSEYHARNYMVCKAYNIYYLSQYRKGLS